MRWLVFLPLLLFALLALATLAIGLCVDRNERARRLRTPRRRRHAFHPVIIQGGKAQAPPAAKAAAQPDGSFERSRIG